MDDPKNRNEIVILQIENWLDGNVDDFVKPVNAHIKSYALKVNEKPRNRQSTYKWMIENKKRLIIFAQNDINELNQLSENIFLSKGTYFTLVGTGNYAESFYGLEGNCKAANHGGLPSGSREKIPNTGGLFLRIEVSLPIF